MRNFTHSLCMFCAMFLLASCSYFDTGEEERLPEYKEPIHIDLMHKTQSVEELTDIPTIVSSKTNGGVKIYNLDGDISEQEGERGGTYLPAAVVPISAPPKYGMPLDSDPSVQVYPLDRKLQVPSSAIDPSGDSGSAGYSYTPQPNGAVNEEVSQVMEVPPSYAAARQGSADMDYATLYFAHDSKAIGYDGRQKIAEIARNFDPNRGQGITVEGHASANASYDDLKERQMVNLKVSMERAHSVVESLVDQGVPAEAIRTIAWGEVHPSPPKDGMDQEAASRRVEIISE